LTNKRNKYKLIQMKLAVKNKIFILVGNFSYIYETFHISRKNLKDRQGV